MQYRGLTLDRFQEVAISHLMEGKSVLVSAPTGTGKTIIADWIVDEALRTGRDVVYTAPVKALSNQKFRDWTRLYGDSKVGLVTGDLVIRRDAPCRVMTTEILRNMLLAGDKLDHLLAVILDEIHFLDDRERGTTWEEVLIYLPPSVQVVGLSATLSNLGELAKWMTHVRGATVEVVEEHRRAVPLSFHIASVDTGVVPIAEFEGQYKRKKAKIVEEPRFQRGGRNGRNQRPGRGGDRPNRPAFRTRHVEVFHMAKERELLPMLYFAFSRRDCELYARELSRAVRDGLLDADERAAMEKRLRDAAASLGPALDHDLRALYSKGIAFHHAGLHVQLKALVEELYEQRLLKVLYCTSTFALGINLPARTVVFDALEKFDGRQVSPLTTRQFMQKAGRAGRRGLDDSGHVVIRLDLEDWEFRKPQLDRYKRGAYEPVRSSFNLSWNSVINLLDRHDDAHIRELVAKSFLSWHLVQEAEAHMARADHLDRQVDADAPATRAAKEARRLRRRAARADDRVWDEFQRKVQFLKDTGYLAEDGAFNAGARVLKNLQIAEIPVAELVLSGILEDLDPPTLFGVLCALTNELGRHVQRNFSPRRDDKRLAHDIESIVRSGMVAQAAEIAGMPWTWDPDLLPIGRAWAEGKSLQELLMMIESATDVSGDLITGFRRAKDLASQLEDVYVDIPDRSTMIHELIRTVSRDEVEVVD